MFGQKRGSSGIRVAGSWRGRRPGRTAMAASAALAVLVMLMLTAAPSLDAQGGYRVMHRNLAELVSDAGTIVHGRVLSVRIEPHPLYLGLKTAVVDLEIMELLKGQSSAPFSFRQYLLDDREAQEKLGYKVGQEVLLLMLRPHPQTGLSSPAGMEQGRFRITRDDAGNAFVANRVNNAGIFQGLDPAKDARLQSLSPQARAMLTQYRGGPIPYDQFKAVIQALVAN